MSADRYAFAPLADHDRTAFSSGSEPLDLYFGERAGQEQRRGIARCFVLIDRDGPTIIGYYTLSATAIAATDVPPAVARRLPRYPTLPGILLGRLAVDTRYQGQGFGRRLLIDALRRARAVTAQVAAIAIVVDAKEDAAAGFYAAFGFMPFLDMPLRLFLPVASIREL